jgi:hypothetical protein
MKSNHMIEKSRRVYSYLLKLYPKENHDEFGPEMLQLFTDQCRLACQTNNKGNVFLFWIRILLDLGVSLFREQTSPSVTQGVLETAPDAPLPWRGVIFVLIPGLVFFVAQVAQIMGVDLFFAAIQQAAYFLILPVLLVWVKNRKFPIWGLIPLGMLWKTLLDYGNQIQTGRVYSGGVVPGSGFVLAGGYHGEISRCNALPVYGFAGSLLDFPCSINSQVKNNDGKRMGFTGIIHRN